MSTEQAPPAAGGQGAALAEKARAAAAVAKTNPIRKTITDLFNDQRENIARALPATIDIERFRSTILIAVSQVPTLQECTPASIFGAAMQAAQLGLEPNVMGQCYLVPYWNWKKKKLYAQFIIGYKGLQILAFRTGKVLGIMANGVRRNDFFEHEYGSNEHLIHRPDLLHYNEKDEPYAYYAYAKMVNGAFSHFIMPNVELNRIRDTYSEGYKAYSEKKIKSTPWQSEEDAMKKKTVFRRLYGILPLSIEDLRAVESADETVKEELDKDMKSVPAVDDEIVAAEFTTTEKKAEVGKPTVIVTTGTATAQAGPAAAQEEEAEEEGEPEVELTPEQKAAKAKEQAELDRVADQGFNDKKGEKAATATATGAPPAAAAPAQAQAAPAASAPSTASPAQPAAGKPPATGKAGEKKPGGKADKELDIF
jgi:recombination protein RecT